MASISRTPTQDMPPKGGYNPIQTARVSIRRIISPNIATALTVGSLALGYAGYFWAYKDMRREEIEMTSAKNVVWCLLLAERDREFLKQCRRNRDEERELMKDYPGWEVGTYFGEPVFHRVPETEFVTPNFHEYVVHANMRDSAERYTRHLIL